MPYSETYVRARIDKATKERATATLAAMGLSVSDAIRLLMLRIVDEQRLPFEVRAPEAEADEAMAGPTGDKRKKRANLDAVVADFRGED